MFFRLSSHELVDSQLERIFSEMFPTERWTIDDPSQASDGRYGIALAIDELHGNVMNIGEQHWSLSTGTPLSASVSKNIPTFL